MHKPKSHHGPTGVARSRLVRDRIAARVVGAGGVAIIAAIGAATLGIAQRLREYR